jgi:integrase
VRRCRHVAGQRLGLQHGDRDAARAANVLRRFEQLAQRAGLPSVHLHTLRHSAASFLLAAGTHNKVVQEHLGHSSYAITADIYSHVGPVLQHEAADRLDRALRW